MKIIIMIGKFIALVVILILFGLNYLIWRIFLLINFIYDKLSTWGNKFLYKILYDSKADRFGKSWVFKVYAFICWVFDSIFLKYWIKLWHNIALFLIRVIFIIAGENYKDIVNNKLNSYKKVTI